MTLTGRPARWAVIVLGGLGVLGAAVFGAARLLYGGDITATLPAEPLVAPREALRHTVMILDAGERHFVLRHGIEGNRQFFIVSSSSGNAVEGDELSVYDRGTFTGAAHLKSGKQVVIKDEESRGYFLEGGHVLGWEHSPNTWAVIRSRTPDKPAQVRLLALAEQVVNSVSQPLRAFFSMSYAPRGFVPTHASRSRLDSDGVWQFGLSKGRVSPEAPLTVTTVARRDDGTDDAETMKRLGKPDSTENARRLWRVKPGTPGFSVPPGGAEIVLRRDDGCYVHLRVTDVNLIPQVEQEKIVNGIIIGLCGDTRGWRYPFEGLKNL